VISLTPNGATILYLGLTLLILLVFWAQSYFRSKKRMEPFSRQCLYQCEFCHFAYLDDRHKPVTPCPQCNALNKNNQYQGQK